MERLDVIVRVQTLLLAGDRRLQRVAADARGNAGCLHQVQGPAHHVNPAGHYLAVGPFAMRVQRFDTFVDQFAHLGLDLLGLRLIHVHANHHLQLPAPLLAVPDDDIDRPRRDLDHVQEERKRI